MEFDILDTDTCVTVIDKYEDGISDIYIELGENWEIIASIFYAEGMKQGKRGNCNE